MLLELMTHVVQEIQLETEPRAPHVSSHNICHMYCNLPLINPLSAELNPICHLLALSGAHPIIHISRIRVKMLDKP
jgi:hypothetical protein